VKNQTPLVPNIKETGKEGGTRFLKSGKECKSENNVEAE